MGSYFNPGSESFRRALRSEIYADKTGLISSLNRVVCTQQRYVCISRPMQFGKTMAMDMLAAYYGCGEDAKAYFADLAVSADASFEEHLNRYYVIRVNMYTLLDDYLESGISRLTARLTQELTKAFPETEFLEKDSLVQVMTDIYSATKRPFVILLDEWDAPLRDKRVGGYAQPYLNFLRSWLKDQEYVALACMTGLLPISRYETGAALNMFRDNTLLSADGLEDCFGLTLEEAGALQAKYGLPLSELEEWYGGYRLESFGGRLHALLHPRSAVEAMLRRGLEYSWSRSEECRALEAYLRMDHSMFDDVPLGEEILLANAMDKLLEGRFVPAKMGIASGREADHFSRDEWLTLLVHLGYLAYEALNEAVYVPNREARRLLRGVVDASRKKTNGFAMADTIFDETDSLPAENECMATSALQDQLDSLEGMERIWPEDGKDVSITLRPDGADDPDTPDVGKHISGTDPFDSLFRPDDLITPEPMTPPEYNGDM